MHDQIKHHSPQDITPLTGLVKGLYRGAKFLCNGKDPYIFLLFDVASLSSALEALSGAVQAELR